MLIRRLTRARYGWSDCGWRGGRGRGRGGGSAWLMRRNVRQNLLLRLPRRRGDDNALLDNLLHSRFDLALRQSRVENLGDPLLVGVMHANPGRVGQFAVGVDEGAHRRTERDDVRVARVQLV